MGPGHGLDKEPLSYNKYSLSGLAPLEAVLFDIDGTLCDSDPLHYYAFRELLLQGLFPNWDLEKGLKFTDDKEALFRKLAKDQVKPLNGLHKIRKWIEDRGLKRAAVSNAPRPNAELMISLLGLSDFFHAVVVGSECDRAKPFPDPYLKALEVLQVSKDHTFIFEDSVSGIKAGVAAEMPVVGLTTRNPESLLMEAKPVFLIRDYDDPKLWAALAELDQKGAPGATAAA
ncbi:Haloacid dehalogenase-like hydrolase domain-containing protein Sgpp [Vitis vinifera]|uniref:Haloacid dehalogenase-like hydrolase domain-containing protein Sgpp n=1 Tax=Vitis vinifera TaxID=29760 RepID=A0A438JZG5_VITVI|nr:Haloacid dehalogenase-like hydrolase domain-containing protein Sgpp [Vitis vinifera]